MATGVTWKCVDDLTLLFLTMTVIAKKSPVVGPKRAMPEETWGM